MLTIKLIAGEARPYARGVDYSIDQGAITVHDADGEAIGSVASGQWVFVDIPPET